jgi:Zn-finger protein
MSADCISEEVAFIPCLHADGSKCLLAYCPACNKDLYRECEREPSI